MSKEKIVNLDLLKYYDGKIKKWTGDQIGTLSDLKTTAKDNTVAAINELVDDSSVATAAIAKAQKTADDASAAAAAAQKTADDASTAAAKAQSTADDASSAAAKAQSTADDASKAAADASTAAAKAQSTADDASKAAADASSAAAAAQKTADDASKAAADASKAAADASSAAAAAQKTADDASKAAADASKAAADASSAAAKAQSTADDASKAAADAMAEAEAKIASVTGTGYVTATTTDHAVVVALDSSKITSTLSASDDTALVTLAAVKNLGTALHYKGMGTSLPTDASQGDVYILTGTESGTPVEYIYDGTTWQEFGDEGMYATKTQLGTLSDLKTTAKDSAVSAINEVYDDASAAQKTADDASKAAADASSAAAAAQKTADDASKAAADASSAAAAAQKTADDASKAAADASSAAAAAQKTADDASTAAAKAQSTADDASKAAADAMAEAEAKVASVSAGDSYIKIAGTTTAPTVSIDSDKIQGATDTTTYSNVKLATAGYVDEKVAENAAKDSRIALTYVDASGATQSIDSFTLNQASDASIALFDIVTTAEIDALFD